MTEIERFNKDVSQNEGMQEELKAIGNDIPKIVAYANEKGYAFTVADLEAKAKESGELSEEQLDDVAGGALVATAVAKAAVVF